MYDAGRTKKLQQQTASLLKDIAKLQAAQTDELRDVLRFHEYRYYVNDDPLIADVEYDQLFKALEKLEKANPDLVSSDSPTQRVAKGLTKDFPTVAHLVPMLSLENSYNQDDLVDWDKKVRQLSGSVNIKYCVEPKFDGASISLIYEHDMLTRGATRGDGIAGDEITTNVRQIRSVPLSAKFSSYGVDQIEIRGEVLMNKKSFAKYNASLAEQGLAPLANPRNAASGSLRIKDSTEVRKRNLEAFLYNVSYYTLVKKADAPEQLDTHSGTLKMLWDLGFRSPVKELKVLTGIEAVIEYCREYEAKRDKLDYEIDGMVIKVDSLDLQDKLGMTTHHPRWAIAYKFSARQATSKLRKVEFQVGRTGSVTPVAKIDPVPIGGVTVASVSLFNEDVVREKDLMIGDTVLVERAGDVIPYIVKPLAELRDGTQQKIKFPVNCPECGDKLFKPEGEAVWRCVNANCKAQVVERIIHFVSKDAMDIRSMGESNVRKFYELGFLSDIPAIYRLPFNEIRKMEGFGEKSITNLESAIGDSKSQPLNRLIFALGIRYVGETTAKVLSKAINHLLDLKDYSVEQLEELEDVGVKVAGSIYQFFSNQDNITMLKTLESLGLNLKNSHQEDDTPGQLAGMTFLFTGTLSKFKRSDAEEMVEAKGGALLSGVSSKLNYLVVGEDAGSKLEKAKKIHSIRILTEDQFLTLIGNS